MDAQIGEQGNSHPAIQLYLDDKADRTWDTYLPALLGENWFAFSSIPTTPYHNLGEGANLEEALLIHCIQLSLCLWTKRLLCMLSPIWLATYLQDISQ